MKKLFAVLLAAAMLMAIASACGSTTTTPATPTPSTSTPSTTPSTPSTTPSTPSATPATPATTDPAEEKVLVVRLTGEPPTLQPDKGANDSAYNVVSNIYSRLVKLDGSRQIIPDLASSWETSADGLSVTFHLVDNAYWHDGEKVTSADVKYTMDYILTHDTCLMYPRFNNYIESVEAPDDLTVVFHMKNQYGPMLVGRLGYYATFILPQHLFDNGQDWDDNPYSLTPVGCGPFKYDSTIPGVSITLVKNENYFQNEVKLDRLIFQVIPDATTALQALKNGEIDFMTGVPTTEVAGMLTDSNFVLTPSILPSPTYMLFNFNDEVVSQYAVRLAIAKCVNREEVSTKVFTGIRTPETHFYPSVIEWASNPNALAPEFDIEGAKKVLEDAGFTKDADGYYIRGLELCCSTGDSNPDVAKLIAANAKEAGIEIIVNSMESQAWTQKVSTEKNFQISLTGGFQGPDVADLSGRVGTGQSTNYGSYSNAKVDELFAQGLLSTDQDVRRPYYYEIQKILSEELPIVPIVQYISYQGQGSYVTYAPLQSIGLAGWVEFSYTDIVG